MGAQSPVRKMSATYRLSNFPALVSNSSILKNKENVSVQPTSYRTCFFSF